MSRVIGRISLIALPKGTEWVLEHDVTYHIDVGVAENAWVVVVQEKFVTDLASRPTVMAMLLDKWGKHGPASLIHDWLYWFQICDRETADAVMVQFMKKAKVPTWKIVIINRCLRMFGGLAWRNNVKRKAAGEQAFFVGDLDKLHYLAELGDRDV